MAGPLVATKLYVPKLRPGSVSRPRLVERLRANPAPRLTLVSAPAGFGKTTVLAEWLAALPAGGARIAWLSLDPADNEPRTFWSHVVSALHAAAGVGASARSLVDAGEPPGDAFLATLLNELGGAPDSIILVLDDYHLIDRAEIHAGIGFLLDHLPPHVHLAVSTRADPPLPLARLRARGELVEIRSADLRFTAAEAAEYLNGMMGLGLTASDVAELDARTEGWIAALQLAALSLRGREDAAAFIASFAGNDRYVFDYLVEEVLQRQPAEVRAFLLDTCFLDRLSGPLCDAIRDAAGSGVMLEALHRQNLFVVPLDDRRQWYRYHHLFADVLKAHLVEAARSELPLLHRRASAWYEKQGERGEAVRHALAGKDFERAGALIAAAIPDLRRTRQEVLLRAWLKALPDVLVRSRPELSVGLAGALLSNGEFDGIEGRLLDAERALAASTEQATQGSERERLPAQIALYRAAMAQVRGDMPAMLAHAQRAADLAPDGDHLGHAAASGLLGIAHWTLGDLGAAHAAWSDCFTGLAEAGHVADALGATIALADISRTRGRLRDAATAFERGLALAGQHGAAPPRGLADLYAGLAELSLERGDLAAARRDLATSEELGERAGLGPQRYRWCVASAALLHAEDDSAGALDRLAEAERVYVADFFPNLRPVAAIAARLRIAQGDLQHAARWRRDSGVGPGDDPTFLREYEHLTLARLLLAEQRAGRTDRTAPRLPDLLARLEAAAERGGRTSSVIEITILRALAEDLRGTGPAALGSLERALVLAEPEGYVRPFVDAGPAMADLLRNALRKSVAPAYIRELLAAFAPRPAIAQAQHPDLIEPLSERELDVLRLLRSELDGPAIARELAVSLNTMRTHTKNIYEKLGVNSRRTAVRRAEELNLLQRRAPR